jgi:hypothetical protein
MPEIIKRKALTIEDLVKFCAENKMYSFNSKDQGYKLSVQVPATFEMDENVDEAHRGMLKLKFRIFHTGLNRNGSFVSENAAKDAMPTIKNRPIMAAIHQLDNGEWDFESHNFEIVKNEETGEEEINYIEKQVGSFDESEPFFEYDEELDKTFICSYGYIAEDYTKAADIIRRKNGTKNSCELSIDELSFNAKEHYLSLDKFYVAASTLLGSRSDGTEIGEGMEGSRADIADFSVENNSIKFDENEELLNEIKKLNEHLSHININQEDSKSSEIYGKEENGSMNDEIKVEEEVTEVDTVEEVTEVMEETVEETTEEVVEETSEEVTETEEFTEEVAETETDETVEEGTPEVGEEDEAETDDEEKEEETSEESETEETDEEVETVEFSSIVKYSVESKGEVKTYEISLDEKIYAIQDLVNLTYGESDNTYYGVKVYADHVIMLDYWTGRAYKQSYSEENDSYVLTGDRVEVYSVWVTKEEEESLNEMRSNYASLVQFKEDTENAQLHAQREEILNNEKYSVLTEKDENNEYKNEAYAKLVSEMDNYSLSDLEKELKSVFADYITNGGQFAYAGTQEVKTNVSKKLFATSTGKKTSRYGNLFNK